LSPLRLRLFAAAALLAAVLFVRLGVWQLDRRAQRRAWNATVKTRLSSPEVDWEQLPRDTSLIRYRRVLVHGTPDYDHERVLAARTRRGSPGVNLITPLRFNGRDTALIVNRGWVYSPDGATVSLSRWHTNETVYSGYVDILPPSGGAPFKERPQVLSRLSLAALTPTIPYPVAPFYLVALGDTIPAIDRPANLELPPLDDGPHLSYAIQWFAFAAVALGGAAAVLSRYSRRND
jgi:surfeit locus 1 family protein